MRELFKRVDEILLKVSKPVRYVGNEVNAVHKNHQDVDVSFAFAFPDVYEIGMSHLGMKILYHLLNDGDDVVCERVFAPWVDMEKMMREHKIPLFSLESVTPLTDFDIIGFTLQYEMSYTNILNMLDLAGIPLKQSERGNEHPLIIAGGPCAFNPEPLADYIDVFFMGDGEESICEIVDMVKEWKKGGKRGGANGDRTELLLALSAIPGAYVPSFYDVTYNEDGTIKGLEPKFEGVPKKICKRVVKDLDNVYYPRNMIVPFMQVVHDRIPLEVARGCCRGCRFCQAGIIYRPVRERSADLLQSLAESLIKNTGYEELSLTSLSTSDYSEIKQLITALMNKYAGKELAISLPSLRADSFSIDLAMQVQRVRKTGLTLAPEAGTQRLRDVINKGITEEDILQSVEAVVSAGWNLVKLYFMIGLPTETYEDIQGIIDIAKKVAQIDKRLNVTVSVSTFVPKPHTPFQWFGQDTLEQIEEKQDYLRSNLRHRRIKLNLHDPRLSMLEAVFSRGDRRLGRVLERALELGCKFDGWSEHFSFAMWMQAFSDCGIDPGFYSARIRDVNEVLPWEHIDSGVTREFLQREREKALAGETTEDCRSGICSDCGICVFISDDGE
jgi:radical SAM family uncharacterized protein